MPAERGSSNNEKGRTPCGIRPPCVCAFLRSCRGRSASQISELAAVDRAGAQLLFDAEELIVLGDTVGAGSGPGLDLASVGRDRDVGDRYVLGLARAMRDDGRVLVFL